VKLLKGKPAKLNLIPFNPFPGTRYKRSSAEAIQRFRDELIGRGVLATVRRTRGDDIDAACGQLAGRVSDRTKVRLGNKLIVERSPPSAGQAAKVAPFAAGNEGDVRKSAAGDFFR
jgi:hypothetical protein